MSKDKTPSRLTTLKDWWTRRDVVQTGAAVGIGAAVAMRMGHLRMGFSWRVSGRAQENVPRQAATGGRCRGDRARDELPSQVARGMNVGRVASQT